MLVGLVVAFSLQVAVPQSSGIADPCTVGADRHTSGRVAVNLSLRWAPQLRVARPCTGDGWRFKTPATIETPRAPAQRASPCEREEQEGESERTPAPYSMFWMPEDNPLLSSAPGAIASPFSALRELDPVCGDSVETKLSMEPAIALAFDVPPRPSPLSARPTL